jgi:hypothetical protein
MPQPSQIQSQCLLQSRLPWHRDAGGAGCHRSHGFGMPGTTLNPVAFSLPAGHRFSTGAELMPFTIMQSWKSLSEIKTSYRDMHTADSLAHQAYGLAYSFKPNKRMSIR